MKRVLPTVIAALLLSACPDSRVPKPPPRVPEPKLETTFHNRADGHSRLLIVTDGRVAASIA